MNWDDLLARKVRPPFVPSVVSTIIGNSILLLCSLGALIETRLLNNRLKVTLMVKRSFQLPLVHVIFFREGRRIFWGEGGFFWGEWGR